MLRPMRVCLARLCAASGIPHRLQQLLRCHDDRGVPQAAPAARPPLAGLEVPQPALCGAADFLRGAGKTIRWSQHPAPRRRQPPPPPPTVAQPPAWPPQLSRLAPLPQAFVVFSYYNRITAAKARRRGCADAAGSGRVVPPAGRGLIPPCAHAHVGTPAAAREYCLDQSQSCRPTCRTAGGRRQLQQPVARAACTAAVAPRRQVRRQRRRRPSASL